jgi:hypothetical protein
VTGDSDFVDLLARKGVIAAAEARAALGISAPTLSRVVKGLSSRVARLGEARATRYALRRTVPGLPSEVPIFRVSDRGALIPAGALVPLAGRRHWVQPRTGGAHLHEGLPPFVHDTAPQGFLGRSFPELHPDLELPRRVQDWSDDHRLIAVARRGEDCVGDLVVGEESANRLLRSRPAPASVADYPELARGSAGRAGSSAGGEQPKFTAFVEGRHVLVKFTAGDRSPSDLRWRDLLACEAVALDLLRERGVPASRAALRDLKSQRFLEVERFDRAGARGRRGILTLSAVDLELYGRLDNWSQAAARLEEDRLLGAEDARRLRTFDAFGALIHNTDRHFGNVSLFADALQGRPALELAPAYDMLPMAFAPVPGTGVVPEVAALPPPPWAKVIDVWDEAAEMAFAFWDRVARDERVSRAFRSAARRLQNAPAR